MSSRAIAVAIASGSASAIAIAAGSGCGTVAVPRDIACNGQPVEVLRNGGFDDAEPAWAQDPATRPLLCGAPRITPVDGAQAACLGSTDGVMQTLSQDIELPAGALTIRLSGQLCITTAETDNAEHDALQFDVVAGDATIAALGRLTNRQGVPACQFGAFEQTAALASDPESARLRIRATLDTDRPTSFFLDALHVTVTCKP